jgi:hypothetical protein
MNGRPHLSSVVREAPLMALHFVHFAGRNKKWKHMHILFDANALAVSDC